MLGGWRKCGNNLIQAHFCFYILAHWVTVFLDSIYCILLHGYICLFHSLQAHNACIFFTTLWMFFPCTNDTFHTACFPVCHSSWHAWPVYVCVWIKIDCLLRYINTHVRLKIPSYRKQTYINFLIILLFFSVFVSVVRTHSWCAP